MENFHKYLIGLRAHYRTLQQVIEMGEDPDQIEMGRFAISLIDDIIHHFELFVKANEVELPEPPEPSVAIKGTNDVSDLQRKYNDLPE